MISSSGLITALAFSPDGKAVLTGSYDETVRLWNTTDGTPIGPKLQHQGYVWAVAFSPDGKTVVTGSNDTRRGLERRRRPPDRPAHIRHMSVPWRSAPTARPS